MNTFLYKFKKYDIQSNRYIKRHSNEDLPMRKKMFINQGNIKHKDMRYLYYYMSKYKAFNISILNAFSNAYATSTHEGIEYQNAISAGIFTTHDNCCVGQNNIKKYIPERIFSFMLEYIIYDLDIKSFEVMKWMMSKIIHTNYYKNDLIHAIFNVLCKKVNFPLLKQFLLKPLEDIRNLIHVSYFENLPVITKFLKTLFRATNKTYRNLLPDIEKAMSYSMIKSIMNDDPFSFMENDCNKYFRNYIYNSKSYLTYNHPDFVQGRIVEKLEKIPDGSIHIQL